MAIYSYSRLSTFEKCPLKFKFQYIDKIEPEIKQTIEGFLGNKVHESLQWIYEEIAKAKKIVLEDVLRHFVTNWNREFNKRIRIVREDLDAEHYFNLGIKFLVDYFFANSPFRDNTIATEKKVVVDLDKEGKYRLQGYIDRLVYDREKNLVEIHDYKTGYLKSQEELDQDRQLALYSLAVKEMFEEINEIRLIWHFLAFNEKKISKRSDEQLESLKKEIMGMIDRIESTKEFLPSPGVLCKWCEFRNHCQCKDKC